MIALTKNGETVLTYQPDEAGFIQARKHLAKLHQRFGWTLRIVSLGEIRFNLAGLVALSVQFLRAIGEGPTSELAQYRGRIVALREVGSTTLAKVEWTHGESQTVNLANLAEVGPNPRYCNCG